MWVTAAETLREMEKERCRRSSLGFIFRLSTLSKVFCFYTTLAALCNLTHLSLSRIGAKRSADYLPRLNGKTYHRTICDSWCSFWRASTGGTEWIVLADCFLVATQEKSFIDLFAPLASTHLNFFVHNSRFFFKQVKHSPFVRGKIIHKKICKKSKESVEEQFGLNNVEWKHLFVYIRVRHFAESSISGCDTLKAKQSLSIKPVVCASGNLRRQQRFASHSGSLYLTSPSLNKRLFRWIPFYKTKNG